jgi:hypothetical protein
MSMRRMHNARTLESVVGRVIARRRPRRAVGMAPYAVHMTAVVFD